MGEKTVEISDSRSSHLAVSLCWEPSEHTRLYKFKKFFSPAYVSFLRTFSFFGFLRYFRYSPFEAAPFVLPEDTNLDLNCYIFDEHGRYICCVSGDPRQLMDPSGAVNHTGDNNDGYGRIDESISLHLRQMPNEYKQFIFVVTSPHGRPFHDVKDGEVIIENRSTNEVIYSTKFASSGGANHLSYVACCIYNQPQGWHVEEMNHYTGLEDNWPVYLRRYLINRA